MTDEKAHFKILAGWLIDGTGSPVKHHAVMEVFDGTVTSVSDDIGSFNGVEDGLDLSHCTVLPCLMDSHVHLGMSGDTNPEVRRQQLEYSYPEAKIVIAGNLDKHLAYGIAAVRDGGDRGGHVQQYKQESLNREFHAVEFSVAGKAWHASGQYGRLIGRSPLKGQSLVQAVAEGCQGVDHIKIVNSGVNSLTDFAKETLPQFPQEDLAKAVIIAANNRLKVMVHANGKRSVGDSILAGCHSIEHGFFMGRDNLALMAEKEIVWVPTAITMKAYSEMFGQGTIEGDIARRNFEHQLSQIAIAEDLGVELAVGTDSGSPGVHHGQAVWEEIALFMEAGLSLERAVQCASSSNAELLGIGTRLGSLVKGRDATFLAVKGEPGELFSSTGNLLLYIKGTGINNKIKEQGPGTSES